MPLLEPEIVLLYTLLAKADVGDLEAIQLTIRTVLLPIAQTGGLQKAIEKRKLQ